MSAQEVSRTEVFLPILSEQSSASSTLADEHDHEHHGIGHIPEHGRFTTNNSGDQSWPPQVKYIDDVAWDYRVNAAMLELDENVDKATAIVDRDSRAKELLGERYTFISTSPIREKGVEAPLGQKVIYFSYSNNVTVEATVQNDTIAEIETIAAEDWQPALRQNEVEAAIEIARQFWQQKGISRVDDLQGFTIQTFRTEGAGGYYDTRMSYVSFHIDEVSDPELLTWVDLTTETVYKAAIDQAAKDGGMKYVQ